MQSTTFRTFVTCRSAGLVMSLVSLVAPSVTSQAKRVTNRSCSRGLSSLSLSFRAAAIGRSHACCPRRGGGNAKRIYRLWRQEGLKVPKKKAKRRRLGSSDGGIIRRRAEHKNHVWSMDFVFDRTANGRPVKIFSMIDEYTRECIA